MPRRLVLTLVSLLFVATLSLFVAHAARQEPAAQAPEATAPDPSGALVVLDKDGRPQKLACPLKHTDVQAEVTGFLARVRVTQEFENPFKDKIEAVYTFPLPQAAAVDDMTMQVGERTVRGKILRREEAQAVYAAARNAGQVASLLDQERPNIFTQSVANIMPGERVTVTLSYVETLKYEAGTYEFVFPMTVAPRYVPGTATGQQAGGFAPDTTRVPDASRITPRVAPEGMRAGHDISLAVKLDAGVPLDGVTSSSHAIELARTDERRAVVRLKDSATIPNKDFILRYDVAGKRINDALLTHRAGRGGFFTLILQPPEQVEPDEITAREIVFVLDTSGSMSGFPIEKAKQTMQLALTHLNPQDTFNLITFAGDTHILFPQPVPPTAENMKRAQSFLASRSGSGGTEMMKAIRAALDPSDAQAHVRVVCFMTDGEVGNDMEIIGEVQKHPNARVFSFGIGQSVNRFLLDKIAEYGRGEAEYVTLEADGDAAAKRFHERVRAPLLTDITIEWNGLPIADVYPQRLPDLFSAKPVIVTGRYTAGGRGTIKLQGKVRGRDYVREIPVVLPETEEQHDVLATLWARRRVDDLMGQDMNGMQQNNPRADLRETITQLGLEFRLMTQFTSFVAVEEMTYTDGGTPRRVDVPIELPEGVNSEAVFGSHPTGPTGLFSANLGYISNSNSNGTAFQLFAGKRQVTYSGGGSGVNAPIEMPNSPPTVTVQATVAPTKPTTASAPPAPQPTPPPASGTMNELVTVTDAERTLSKEEQKQQELYAKLHPALQAVVERLKKKESQPTADEVQFVRDGKAELRVWLTDTSPEVLAQLKQLGFEIVLAPKTAKLLIGRLSIDKLSALAELKAVRYIAPQPS
ncbi:MAG: VIT and vWA domain-containing protein [Pyrinomonadaceae bacterium]